MSTYRTVKTRKSFNAIPSDAIKDPAVIEFVKKLMNFLTEHLQQNYDDVNSLQKTESCTTLPTAEAAIRGKLFVVDGGAGVADVVNICVKKVDDTYGWKVVTIT